MVPHVASRVVPVSGGRWGQEHKPHASRGGLHRFALPAAVGGSAIYAAQSVTVETGDLVMFGGITGLAGIFAVRALTSPLPRRVRDLTALWVLFAVLYVLVSSLQIDWQPTHVLGDGAVALLPLLMMLTFAARPRWLQGRPAALGLLLALLLLAAVEARLIGMLGARHAAPSVLLIAGVWYYALEAQSRRMRILTWPLVGLVGILAYSSGYRTHLILWALAPVVIIVIFRGGRGVFKSAILALVVWVGLGLAGVEIDPLDNFNDSRFDAILAGRPDESLESRVAELRDVELTAEREWLPGQQLVGYGFGATYQPHYSFIEANVGDNGRVHSVHIGPALVLFRFGLFGLIIVASLIVLTWRTLRDVRHHRTGTYNRGQVGVLALAVTLYAGEFLVLNPTVQPVFAFSLGGLLAVRALYRSELHAAGDNDPPGASGLR